MAPPLDLVHRTRRALLGFYDAGRRDLPWRAPPGGSADPYAVWISEVMLQQTRVDTVVPYYRAWMERFPDVGALAAAPLDEVLRAWEGLGYYARARGLHRAALVVRDRLGGDLPGDVDALRALPGVGEYTAGAVASIAFGRAVPAVDGNVRRVLARLFDEPRPGAAWLRERAAALVDPDRPGDFNQALMELGATVCAPRRPACDRCPLAADCAARASGTQAERPHGRTRGAVPDVEIAVAALVRPGAGGPELLLARRPPDGLLGGLWELPGAAVDGGDAAIAASAAARAVGAAPRGRPDPLPARTHVYSHFRGVYRPFLWHAGSGARPAAGADVAWADAAALAALALPRVQRRIASALMERAPEDRAASALQRRPGG